MLEEFREDLSSILTMDSSPREDQSQEDSTLLPRTEASTLFPLSRMEDSISLSRASLTRLRDPLEFPSLTLPRMEELLSWTETPNLLSLSLPRTQPLPPRLK